MTYRMLRDTVPLAALLAAGLLVLRVETGRAETFTECEARVTNEFIDCNEEASKIEGFWSRQKARAKCAAAFAVDVNNCFWDKVL